jgi:hypothetical protein
MPPALTSGRWVGTRSGSLVIILFDVFSFFINFLLLCLFLLFFLVINNCNLLSSSAGRRGRRRRGHQGTLRRIDVMPSTVTPLAAGHIT